MSLFSRATMSGVLVRAAKCKLSSASLFRFSYFSLADTFIGVSFVLGVFLIITLDRVRRVVTLIVCFECFLSMYRKGG